MSQTVPAYVISLDGRPDRWRTISGHLNDLGIEAERIAAVDARDLLDKDRCFGPLGEVPLGSVANMMRQSIAMRHLLESTAPAALFLEDDAELAADPASLFNGTDWWPMGALSVRLEDAGTTGVKQSGTVWLQGSSGQIPSGRTLHRLERFAPGSAAYLINRAGALLALAAFDTPKFPTDLTLFDPLLSRTARQLRTVQVVPAMARQRLHSSAGDIEASRHAVLPTVSAQQRARRRRALLRLPRRLRLRALRVLGLVRRMDLSYRA